MKKSTLLAVVLLAIGCSGERIVGHETAPLPVNHVSPELIRASLEASDRSARAMQDKLTRILGNQDLGMSVRDESSDRAALIASLQQIIAGVDSNRRVLTTMSIEAGPDGTPAYPADVSLGFVDAGTFLILPTMSGFMAHTWTTNPAILSTSIRGNTSTGWTGSSDDGGVGVSAEVIGVTQPASLAVPDGMIDCHLSSVSVWGNSEHRAKWVVPYALGPLATVNFQVRSISVPKVVPGLRCEHTPVSGAMVTGGNRLEVGEVGGAGVIWQGGAPGNNVSDCPTMWTASSGAIDLGQGTGQPAADSRSVNAVSPGTATGCQ